MTDVRRPDRERCRHVWAPTGSLVTKPGRTLGSRCVHCGRYSYRPSPPPEPRQPFLR